MRSLYAVFFHFLQLPFQVAESFFSCDSGPLRYSLISLIPGRLLPVSKRMVFQ